MSGPEITRRIGSAIEIVQKRSAVLETFQTGGSIVACTSTSSLDDLISKKEHLEDFDDFPSSHARDAIQADLDEINNQLTLAFLDLNAERERLDDLNDFPSSHARDAVQEDIDELNNELNAAWNRLDVDSRMMILQGVHEKAAADLGIDSLMLEFLDIPDPEGIDQFGGYNFHTEELTIDSDNVDSSSFGDIAKKVAHETRHRFQHLIMEGIIPRPDFVTEEQVQEWRNNLDNYIPPSKELYTEYRTQPLESDAFNYEDDFADDNHVNEKDC